LHYPLTYYTNKINTNIKKCSREIKKMGFTKIFDMEGRFLLWEDEDLETEK